MYFIKCFMSIILCKLLYDILYDTMLANGLHSRMGLNSLSFFQINNKRKNIFIKHVIMYCIIFLKM